ncbi:MAG: hypothetical protein ACLFQ5_13630, partial [Oceanicaulis sp.]
RAFETRVLAVSGRETPPAPGLVAAGLEALASRRAWTGAGALLTPAGVLGRDPGAAGRSGGGAGPDAPELQLGPGRSAVFDGRFTLTGPVRAAMRARRDREGGAYAQIPAPFRETLPVEARTGAALAGPNAQGPVRARWIGAERIASRLMARSTPAWFDEACAEARACAALAKPQPRSNMGS